ncbi:MAG: helix-turn-helix domain-containing protein [Patulibacter sp.]|nr:helix-turn-helix domain-containing protein [Patulibacter sp.]
MAPETLAHLCADIGPELLDVLLAPSGLDVAVGEVAVHDPLDAPAAGLGTGDLLLAVGVADGGADAPELVRVAAAAGAVGVVLKRRPGAVPKLLAAAHEAGIAVLTTHPDVPWGELYGLLRASLAAHPSGDLPPMRGPVMGDLAALADATAAVAGGHVLIEDLHGRVLAFSSACDDVDAARSTTILRRRVPDEWMRTLHRSGVLETLRRAHDVVSLDMFGAPRRAITIRADEALLGVIWLVPPEGGAEGAADGAMRDAARIAALHLKRQRVLDDVDRRVRGSMLRMLLRGDRLPGPMLDRLGLPADGSLAVVVVAGRPPIGSAATLERLVDLVLEHLRAYRWEVAAAVLEGRVYALVTLGEGRDRAGLARTVADCVARARLALAEDLCGGIAPETRAPDEIASARRRADQCVDLSAGDADVVRFEQVHARALLDDTDTFLAGAPIAISPELHALVEKDRDGDTAYVATLRAYLDAHGDMGRAAELVHIHVNTMRYRMRRIVEWTAADLEDADVRLSLALQLRVLR